jgi:hypothetical protein
LGRAHFFFPFSYSPGQPIVHLPIPGPLHGRAAPLPPRCSTQRRLAWVLPPAGPPPPPPLSLLRAMLYQAPFPPPLPRAVPTPTHPDPPLCPLQFKPFERLFRHCPSRAPDGSPPRHPLRAAKKERADLLRPSVNIFPCPDIVSHVDSKLFPAAESSATVGIIYRFTDSGDHLGSLSLSTPQGTPRAL